jgi:hypothetical protein
MATITLCLGEIRMGKKEEEYSIWIQRGKERNSEKNIYFSFVWFVMKRTRKNI